MTRLNYRTFSNYILLILQIYARAIVKFTTGYISLKIFITQPINLNIE